MDTYSHIIKGMQGEATELLYRVLSEGGNSTFEGVNAKLTPVPDIKFCIN